MFAHTRLPIIYYYYQLVGTVGVPVPTANPDAIGTAIVSRLTLQYFIAPYFWPEFAFNKAHWVSGVRGGKNQPFLSPGIVFGRIPLLDRLKAIFGISYQFAVSPELTKTPVLTPVYNHAWLLAMRMPF